MTKYNKLATNEMVNFTIESLKTNNINSYLVNSASEAKAKVLAIIPVDSEVMTMSSVTLQDTGITSAINETDQYKSVRKQLASMNRSTQGEEMQKISAAPSWALGSVQAVTQDGHLVFVSATGSQLPAYAYGSDHVILVVSTKKIVPSLDEAMKRVYEYVLPLESERAKKAYGVPGSAVNKTLVINKEVTQNRIQVVFVKEDLGY